MEPEHVPVGGAGAGPTGASVAIMLGRRGVRCLVLERWPEVYPLPRAVHFDDDVFRIFADMDPADEVAEISRPVPGMRLTDRHHRVLAELNRDATHHGPVRVRYRAVDPVTGAGTGPAREARPETAGIHPERTPDD